MNKKAILATVIIVLILVVVCLGFLYLKYPTSQSKYSSAKTVNSVLSQTSVNFANAQQERQNGNYPAALTDYQKSLPDAQDAEQTAQINYNIALMQMYNGDFADAINGIKAVAADQGAGPSAQAYAVQQLGVMYYTYYKDSSQIAAATFTGTPYASFLQANNIGLAYRHLFEYATSFYPIGFSEAMIAQWYANDITQTLNGATTTPQAVSDLGIIQSDLQKADTDVQNTKSNPVTGLFVPAILNREGIVTGDLASVGIGTDQQAESYFQQSMQYDAVFANKPGSFDAYNYASFLTTTYGKSRASDIDKLLSPFTSGNNENIDSKVASFFGAALTNPTLVGQKAIIAKMGGIDPSFKTYLESLGWNASDF